MQKSEDIDDQIAQRQSMTGRGIKVPIKPLDSGKNSNARPVMFSNVEDMGSDSGDDNNMDALLDNTAERRDTGRSIKFEPSKMEKIALADNNDLRGSISNRVAQKLESGSLQIALQDNNDLRGITSNRIATKLESGSLPKPPISTKSGLPQPPPSTKASTIPKTAPTTTSQASQLKPPPSTRASTTLQGSLPQAAPVSRQTTITQAPPSTKSALPQAPPSTRSSMPGTLPQAPPSTRNAKVVTLPKAPATKEETKEDPMAMPGMDDYFANRGAKQFSEDDQREQRQSKLLQAQALKAKLQDELARNEQQKLANMTPEEQIATLAEKKRQEDEKKLTQDQLLKQKEQDEKLQTEITQLKKELKSIQNDIEQYQQKQKKLQELETRVNVMQATEKDELQKQEQELKQAQTEFQQASELWQKTAEQAKLVQDKNRQFDSSQDAVVNKHVEQEKTRSRMQADILEQNLQQEKFQVMWTKLTGQLAEEGKELDREQEEVLEMRYHRVELQHRKREQLIVVKKRLQAQNPELMKKVQNLKVQQSSLQDKLAKQAKYKQEVEFWNKEQSAEQEMLNQFEQTSKQLQKLGLLYHDTYAELTLLESDSLHDRNAARDQSKQIEAQVQMAETSRQVLEKENKDVAAQIDAINKTIQDEKVRLEACQKEHAVLAQQQVGVDQNREGEQTKWQSDAQEWAIQSLYLLKALQSQVEACDATKVQHEAELTKSQQSLAENQAKASALTSEHEQLQASNVKGVERRDHLKSQRNDSVIAQEKYFTELEFWLKEQSAEQELLLKIDETHQKVRTLNGLFSQTYEQLVLIEQDSLRERNGAGESAQKVEMQLKEAESSNKVLEQTNQEIAIKLKSAIEVENEQKLAYDQIVSEYGQLSGVYETLAQAEKDGSQLWSESATEWATQTLLRQKELDLGISECDRATEANNAEIKLITTQIVQHQQKTMLLKQSIEEIASQSVVKRQSRDEQMQAKTRDEQRLTSVEGYMAECVTEHQTVLVALTDLKLQRVGQLAEAIKSQQDESEWHKDADLKIADLQAEHQSHTDDVAKYELVKTAHQEIINKVAQVEQEHIESKERADMEHTEHITGLETITTSVAEHIALIAECESLRGSLQESHAQVQASHRAAVAECDAHAQLITETSVAHEEHQSLLLKHEESLAQHNEEFEQLQSQLLALQSQEIADGPSDQLQAEKERLRVVKSEFDESVLQLEQLDLQFQLMTKEETPELMALEAQKLQKYQERNAELHHSHEQLLATSISLKSRLEQNQVPNLTQHEAYLVEVTSLLDQNSSEHVLHRSVADLRTQLNSLAMLLATHHNELASEEQTHAESYQLVLKEQEKIQQAHEAITQSIEGIQPISDLLASKDSDIQLHKSSLQGFDEQLLQSGSVVVGLDQQLNDLRQELQQAAIERESLLTSSEQILSLDQSNPIIELKTEIATTKQLCGKKNQELEQLDLDLAQVLLQIQNVDSQQAEVVLYESQLIEKHKSASVVQQFDRTIISDNQLNQAKLAEVLTNMQTYLQECESHHQQYVSECQAMLSERVNLIVAQINGYQQTQELWHKDADQQITRLKEQIQQHDQDKERYDSAVIAQQVLVSRLAEITSQQEEFLNKKDLELDYHASQLEQSKTAFKEHLALLETQEQEWEKIQQTSATLQEQHSSVDRESQQHNQLIQTLDVESLLLKQVEGEQELEQLNAQLNAYLFAKNVALKLKRERLESATKARLTLDEQQQLTGYMEELAAVEQRETMVVEASKQERLQTLAGLILQQQQSQEAAAPTAGKKRHARNQSMIGQLAASTFEVDDSHLTQAQVEEQVLNALQTDSQGQKVIIVESREDQESLRPVEEESQESDEPKFGAVGPRQDPHHVRQPSAGSVKVAMEPIVEAETNKTPTVPSASKEFRPSIFDMKKQGQQRQGSFRATAYDKTPMKKLIGQALIQRIGGQQHHTDDTVLGDLLVCLLSEKQMMMLHSDLELLRGYELFKQMYEADSKTHEALFGLGRINYVQGRYEVAEKLFIKAYEAKRDFVYRVWLGYAQLQLFFICTEDNPNKIKNAQNAFANLDRCSKEPRVGLYANFALIKLSLALKSQKVKGLQEPQFYQQLIQKKDGRYEASLASAVIQMSEDVNAGISRLNMIVSEDGRPHAHYVLIRHYLRVRDYEKALTLAQEAYQKITDYESFQERLTLILLLCKCLAENNQPQKALVFLQMQYTEQPHFSSLLYAYGKCVVKHAALHQFLPAGISALQEVQRVSIQVRSAKAAYWLAQAAQIKQKKTVTAVFQYEYLNGITQVFKQGPIKQRQLKTTVTSQQLQLLKQIEKIKLNQPQEVSFVLDPSLHVEGQTKLPTTNQNLSSEESLTVCQSFSESRDQQFYKAITLYRLLQDFKQAEPIFNSLIKEYPEDLEIWLERILFLRACVKKKYPVQNPDQEARQLVKLLRQQVDQANANEWAQILINCAKLLFKVDPSSYNDAIEWLMQIKLTMPVIDQQLAAVKLPGMIDRYLPSEELSHIDFQGQGSTDFVETQSSTEFRPQDDYDESNKFFMQTKFAQSKLNASPLATLSVAEIRDQERHKGDQLFYFGNVQSDLAYEVEDNSQQVNNRYYKSATPLIAVIKYLQHLKRVNNQAQDESLDFLKIQDFGFCVRSCPGFLLVVAKICLKINQYIDLAVQCLLEYHQSLAYYKGFDQHWRVKEMEAKLVLALIVQHMSTDQATDLPVVKMLAENVRNNINQEMQDEKLARKVTKLFTQL